MLPVALYGLKVPAGDVMVPASVDFPATVILTHSRDFQEAISMDDAANSSAVSYHHGCH